MRFAHSEREDVDRHLVGGGSDEAGEEHGRREGAGGEGRGVTRLVAAAYACVACARARVQGAGRGRAAGGRRELR